ncbi:amidohydrolase family protein [Roseiconus nitratireducens]|uniref:amidohydrolase family protein n=1 Tax=Roseiconus nitratireducens TaxID=2605748 RepID=UPI0021BCC8BA|nr:amidohydrolase family protein [Roseiconus nitratireducens]
MRTTKGATATLMRGFTSVRDVGGPSFGLKRAIDEGLLAGPRIWPAGATTSQTFQAVREQLMKGAGQIRVMAGDGVASDNDPIDVSQYTEDELNAAVQAAEA